VRLKAATFSTEHIQARTNLLQQKKEEISTYIIREQSWWYLGGNGRSGLVAGCVEKDSDG
jgi:hypothetical protein